MTITHPHHPLYQHRVEVVRIRRGMNPDLIIRLPDGTHAAVAMSLTDYAGIPISPLSGDTPPLLDLRGLRQVVQFLAQRRQAGRYD